MEAKLSCAAQTSTGSDVLIQGVELETMSIPLHKVSLQSDLVSDTVMIGVRPLYLLGELTSSWGTISREESDSFTSYIK